jgi:hypothetical protein
MVKFHLYSPIFHSLMQGPDGLQTKGGEGQTKH